MYIKAVKHIQEIPANSWVINVEEGVEFAQPIFIYNNQEQDISPNDWSFSNGKLIINFGFEAIFGTLVYGYISNLPTDDIKNSVTANTNDILLLKEAQVYSVELDFQDLRYIEMTIPRGLNLIQTSVWETIRSDDGFIVERNSTYSLPIETKTNKATGEKIVYTHSNKPLTGRMVIILNPTN